MLVIYQRLSWSVMEKLVLKIENVTETNLFNQI